MTQDGMSDAEIERRRDAALLRALSMPHKRQSEMKLGKRKGKSAISDSKGRGKDDTS